MPTKGESFASSTAEITSVMLIFIFFVDTVKQQKREICGANTLFQLANFHPIICHASLYIDEKVERHINHGCRNLIS